MGKLSRNAVLTAACLLAIAVPDHSSAALQADSPQTRGAPQNVVLVLLDDVSENLLPYMQELSALAQRGVTFENYFNSTPWCCPSRATIQTGKFPHNTSVRSNSWPNGGFGQFMLNDIDGAIGSAMSNGGYRTGFMGKYLNEYSVAGDQTETGAPPYPANYVPPGWDTWISGDGYEEFSYDVVDNTSGSAITRRVRGISPDNYYTDLLSDEATEFIKTSSEAPFLLMLAPYAAHQGLGTDPEGARMKFPPAPRDRAASPKRPASWPAPDFEGGDCGPVACADVPWPDTPNPENFNVIPENPPLWMPAKRLTPDQVARDRDYHVQRIQMLQSVDDMLGSITDSLENAGHADDTWIVVTSDNGFHLGEHGLLMGKTSALDHDVKVPLIVYPPGGKKPTTVSAMVQSVDLFPTLMAISQQAIAADVDGASLLPWFGRNAPTKWRQSALLELTSASSADWRDNPDTRGAERRGIATTYNAIRTPEYLYVDYSALDSAPPEGPDGEFYDLTSDPAMLHNIYARLAPTDQVALNAAVLDYTGCTGAGCAAAGRSYPPVRVPTMAPDNQEAFETLR